MTWRYWQGTKVQLRALEPTDAELFAAMSADPDYHLIDRRHFPQSAARAQKWLDDKVSSEPKGDLRRFVIETLEGVAVGSIGSQNCDARNGRFDYGLQILREHRRQGYASEAVTLLLRFFFRELRYQKAEAEVRATIPASIALHEGLGFTLEARIRRAQLDDGVLHDNLVYGMTAEEFEERLGLPLDQ